MTFKRQAIAIAGAIVGANIVGIAIYAKAANSSGLCDGFTQLWQGTSRQLSEPAKGEPIGGYFNVKTNRDEPLYRAGEAPAVTHIRQNGAWVEPQANANQDTGRVSAPSRDNPLTTPYPPQPPTRTQVLPPPPRVFAPISGSLLGGESEADYQARRRAIAQQGGY